MALAENLLYVGIFFIFICDIIYCIFILTEVTRLKDSIIVSDSDSIIKYLYTAKYVTGGCIVVTIVLILIIIASLVLNNNNLSHAIRSRLI